MEMETLKQAAAFMAEVRQAAQGRGKSLGGRIRIDEAIQDAIRAQLNQDPLLQALEHSTLLENAMERFSEMCRRQKQAIPATLHSSMHRLLAFEIMANAEQFEISPEKAMPATIGNGYLGYLLQDKRFASLTDTPGIFRQVAVNYPGPGKAEAFLEGVIAAIPRLEQDKRFESLTDTPGIFKQAAVGYPGPGKAEAFLEGVIAAIPRLEQDKRFKSLSDTPWIFRQAAVNYPGPGKAEAFLEGIIAAIPRLEQDKRFESLTDTPWIFTRAAVGYPGPGKAEAFLESVIAAIPRLEQDKRFASLTDTPWIFTRAAVSYPGPGKAEEYLSTVCGIMASGTISLREAMAQASHQRDDFSTLLP